MYLKEYSKTAEERIKGLDEIRKITRYIIDIQTEGCSEQELKESQKVLNEKYDVFVKKYEISKEGLSDYEDGILKLKPYVTNALETGLEDRSLTFSCSVDEMYFSLTHTLLSLMEKLAVGGDILTSDQMVEGNVQLQVMTRLILKGLTQNGSDYE